MKNRLFHKISSKRHKPIDRAEPNVSEKPESNIDDLLAKLAKQHKERIAYESEAETVRGEADSYPVSVVGGLPWSVIDEKGDEVLLFSRFIVGAMPCCDPPFDVGTWKDSYMRKWLHQEFFEETFSPEEKSNIRTHFHEGAYDQLFLLNRIEINDYLQNPPVPELFAECVSRADEIVPASYPNKHNFSTKRLLTPGKCYWWTREKTEFGGEPVYFYVNAKGRVEIGLDYFEPRDPSSIFHYAAGVRPAMWVNSKIVGTDVLESFRKLPRRNRYEPPLPWR